MDGFIAIVVDGKVQYIGITTSVLRSRLDGYSYQSNDRVADEIMRLLKRNINVEIFGIKKPNSEKQGLEKEESRLIKELDPD